MPRSPRGGRRGPRRATRPGRPRRRSGSLRRPRAASRSSASAIGPAPDQHVVADVGKGRLRRRRAARRRAGGERGAVIDQPGATCHSSRLGLRGVRSTLVTSASNQTTSAAVSRSRFGPRRSERERAGRKSTPRLAPTLAWAAPGSRGRARRGRARLERRPPARGPASPALGPARRPQPRPPARPALSGAAELHHVHPVVVGLDQPGSDRPRAAPSRSGWRSRFAARGRRRRSSGLQGSGCRS